MSAEVFSDTAYAAHCDECEWVGEVQAEESDAQREADAHNKTCTDSQERDGRTERDRFQQDMDAIVRQAYVNTKGALA